MRQALTSNPCFQRLPVSCVKNDGKYDARSAEKIASLPMSVPARAVRRCSWVTTTFHSEIEGKAFIVTGAVHGECQDGRRWAAAIHHGGNDGRVSIHHRRAEVEFTTTIEEELVDFLNTASLGHILWNAQFEMTIICVAPDSARKAGIYNG